MLRISLRITASFLLFAGAAQGAPLLEAPRAFDPMSRTANAVTGPVIASESRLIFGNGAQTALSHLSDTSADWGDSGTDVTAQVFAMEADPGELLNGNTLCGGDSPSHLVAYQNEIFGMWSMTLAVFHGEDVPEDLDSPGLCGTYSYALDGPIGVGSDAPAAEEEEVPDVPAAGAPAEEPEDEGKWRISRSTNPIDDTPTISLHLTADSGRSRMGNPVVFIARCQSNTTEAYAIWHDYVGDDSSSPYSEYKYVTVRLGDQESQRQRWSVSTDNEATFAPDWAGTLLKKMVEVDRMVLQLTPYGESPVTAIFDLTGMRGPLRELADTCNWSF